MRLSFGQNDPLMGESFWLKDSFSTHILFELCLFRYLAQSTYFWDTLYCNPEGQVFLIKPKISERFSELLSHIPDIVPQLIEYKSL